MIGDFYDEFFEKGWPYFYSYCLSMLGMFKQNLLEEEEFSGILSYIKFKTPEKGGLDPEIFGSPDKHK
jgi:hypothetical protein